MSFRVQMIPLDRYQIILEGEPQYCHALAMAPPHREEDLNHGWWLVLEFAVWSVPDRQAIPVALNVVKRFGGRVQLGIRPFDYYEEIAAWCPEIGPASGSPKWLILNAGIMRQVILGTRSEEELASAIQQQLKAPDRPAHLMRAI